MGPLPEQNRGLLTKVGKDSYSGEVKSVYHDVIAMLAMT